MWTFEMMLSEKAGWISSPGPRSDVILSTRVRVARNLEGNTFPPRASEVELEEVRERSLGAISKSNYLTNALVIRMEDADLATRRILAERHLVSSEFAEGGPGRAAVVGEHEVVSAMVNEEDHLRLQCIRPGLQPVDAWRLTDRLDRELEQDLQYAFSSDWGYLTSCPTNVGTGIRVSVLAHLMGLARSSRIAKVLGSVSKLGLSIRGFYGEGSAALGGFFQISNQTTLGQTEEDIAYTVERVAAQLAGLELEARDKLVEESGRRIADEGWRAYGLLANARMVSAEEVMELASTLRLGIALGTVDAVDLETVNRLLVVTQPGHLMYAHGGETTVDEEDSARADLVRKELASCDRGAGSP
jgi:protein arginine kinase